MQHSLPSLLNGSTSALVSPSMFHPLPSYHQLHHLSHKQMPGSTHHQLLSSAQFPPQPSGGSSGQSLASLASAFAAPSHHSPSSASHLSSSGQFTSSNHHVSSSNHHASSSNHHVSSSSNHHVSSSSNHHVSSSSSHHLAAMQAAEALQPHPPEHCRRRLFGHLLSVVTLEHEKYLVGVQIATLLKRETFNMYRSMKIKEIPIRRASPEEIDFLCKCGAVRGGTHSVTLIPLTEALYFMADARSKAVEVGVRKANKTLSRRVTFNPAYSFVEIQPRIHRRKPFPWDLRKSLHHKDLVQHSKVSGTNSSIYLVEQPCAWLPRPAQSTDHQLLGFELANNGPDLHAPSAMLGHDVQQQQNQNQNQKQQQSQQQQQQQQLHHLLLSTSPPIARLSSSFSRKSGTATPVNASSAESPELSHASRALKSSKSSSRTAASRRARPSSRRASRRAPKYHASSKLRPRARYSSDSDSWSSASDSDSDSSSDSSSSSSDSDSDSSFYSSSSSSSSDSSYNPSPMNH